MNRCWLLLFAACATAAPVPAEKPAPAPAPVETKPAPREPKPIVYRPLATLSPMTTVVQKSSSPIVSFRIVFRAGSWDDPQGQEGVTALLTRLMAEGGTEKLSATELNDALFPMAAELSADTDKELTVFSGRVHKDRLEPYFAIFTDVLLHPRMDAKELERMRAAHLHVVRDVLPNESDESLSRAGLDALLYDGHPYRHPKYGTVEAVEKLTLDQLKAQRERVFTQDRLILGLAGAVDDALVERLKTALSALPKTGAPLLQPPPAPGPRGRVWILQRDTLSTAGFFGASYDLRRGDPDYFAVALGLSYLGEHREQHGQLFKQLREKRGLNYGTYAYAEQYVESPGPAPAVDVARSTQEWSLWLRPVEPKNAAFATRGALHFLDQAMHAPLPPDAFDAARGFLLGATRQWEQTDQRRLGWAIDELLYGTPHFLDSYRAALERLTPAEVQAAMARHLDPASLDYVYVTKDAAALEAGLKGAAPVQYSTPKAPEVLAADPAIEATVIPFDLQQISVSPSRSFMNR